MQDLKEVLSGAITRRKEWQMWPINDFQFTHRGSLGLDTLNQEPRQRQYLVCVQNDVQSGFWTHPTP